MRLAAVAGVHSRPWSDPRPGAQVARGALVHLHAQVENGTQCPLTMTYASIPVLRRAAPAIADAWVPRCSRCDYDPRDAAARREARRADRHGDDRAAGRVGRPQQSHARGGRRAAAPFG